jgi:predicted DCC family thiol-disulfide oxidoreductase YuxK
MQGLFVLLFLLAMTDTANTSIILFDGVCNLCTASVQTVLKNDRAAHFSFASMQSARGEQLLQNLPADERNLKTFVLIENGKVFTRSTAALRVAKKLDGFWPVLYPLIIVPRFIRDAVYNLVANNRYKWFGKKEACWLPRPEWKKRFIDQDA